jgi:hypothetical protein
MERFPIAPKKSEMALIAITLKIKSEAGNRLATLQRLTTMDLECILELPPVTLGPARTARTVPEHRY